MVANPAKRTNLSSSWTIKHLEFIQAAINRMANNSFLLKGWSVTLTGGLLALTFKQLDRRYLLVSLVVLVFWLLDSYYLYQERKFIALYNHVRKMNVVGIDFSMDTKCYGRRTGWLRCGVSLTLLLFYGGLFTVLLIVRHYIEGDDMARTTFFSFHVEGDSWRAGQVRNSNVNPIECETGFMDACDWEEVKKKGAPAVEQWIASQLEGTSVTAVLIGTETAGRPWVQHEISKAGIAVTA